MSALSGKNFVATRNLYTRDGLVAAAGERCDFVPVQSLASLLAGGKIAPAPVEKPTKKGGK